MRAQKFFPDDIITDQPERQIVAEFIREKALRLLNKEVPHGIAVEIEKNEPKRERDLWILWRQYIGKSRAIRGYNRKRRREAERYWKTVTPGY